MYAYISPLYEKRKQAKITQGNEEDTNGAITISTPLESSGRVFGGFTLVPARPYKTVNPAPFYFPVLKKSDLSNQVLIMEYNYSILKNIVPNTRSKTNIHSPCWTDIFRRFGNILISSAK